jgi:hypothetical protein
MRREREEQKRKGHNRMCVGVFGDGTHTRGGVLDVCRWRQRETKWKVKRQHPKAVTIIFIYINKNKTIINN